MTEAMPDMDWLTHALVQLLDVGPGHAESHFVGIRKPGGSGRVFGGQVVGQALMAAVKTVAEDRLVHSLHCYFMRPASEDFGIDYQVDADMEGRAFSNRRIVARQQDKPIFNMIASFQREEAGPSHQFPMPDVPEPESLLGMRDLLKTFDNLPAGPALRRIATQPSPLEFRPIGPIQSGLIDELRDPYALCWVRIGRGPIEAGQAMQRAMLAYASDMLLLATSYRPHGLQIGGPEVISASIDHSVWFHGDVEGGQWLLYAMDSPFSGMGRGFSRGHFFTQDGRLIASVAQEGLMRLRES
jgi:acyl-CoA thioesterase-2